MIGFQSYVVDFGDGEVVEAQQLGRATLRAALRTY
jgi:hypothetical protein